MLILCVEKSAACTVCILKGIRREKGMNLVIYKYLVILFTVISAVMNVMFAFVLKVVIDSTYTGDVEVLKRYLVFSFLFIVGDIALTVLVNLLKGKYLCHRLIKIKNDYYTASMSRKNKAIVTDLTTKVEQVYVGNLFQKFKILANVVEFIVALGSIIYISWTMTLGIVLVTLVPLAVPLLFSKMVSRFKQQYLDSTEKYVDLLKDTVTGMDTIRGFRLQNIFLEHHEKKNREMEIDRMKSEVSTDTVDATSQNLGFLTFLTALGIGAYYVIVGEMTFGMLIAAVQLMNNLMQPLNNISFSMNKMNAVKEVVQELTDVAVREDDNQTKQIEGIDKIEVRDLCYSVEEREILKNLNVTFEKGHKYALVGESGVGKSTLLKLICRELVPDRGEILLDGNPVGTIREEDLSKSVMFARQDMFIFRDTILNNITLWDSSRTEASLKLLAELNLPDGKDFYARQVNNEEGISEGQRQRINLARTLQHSASVMLFDEITSSLDAPTAKRIMEYICTKFRDQILIFVTHNKEDLKFFEASEIIDLSEVKK